MRIDDLGEFGLIERISRKVRKGGPRVLVGIGDDAAVLKMRSGKLLVATTDTMIEGVHFDLKYSSYYDVGWKAVSSNISDCVAMGGISREILITLGLPAKTPVERIDELYNGIDALAKRFDIDVAGGDTTSSPDKLVVSITLLGEVEKKHLLLRSGARRGDRILVAGTLGDAAAGLKKLKAKSKRSTAGDDRLIARHLRPMPQVEEGRVIARSGLATSMIDNSDGLARCVIEICKMSKVGGLIDASAIPISDDVEKLSRTIVIDAMDLAVNGGEDYGLVFTAPKLSAPRLIDEVHNKTGTKVSIVGEIVNERSGIMLIDASGKKSHFKSRGYDHFRRN